MVISVIGTQCVGKSTFIKDFVANNPDFKIPQTDYRKIIKEKNLRLNRDGDYYSQNILFDFVLNQMLQCHEDDSVNHILDRSIVDVVAYSQWLNENNPISCFSDNKLNEMKKRMHENIYLYDMLVYIPLKDNTHVKIENDTFRDTNEEYRKNIDDIFQELIEDIYFVNDGMKIVNISGDRAQRVDMFKKELLQYGWYVQK